MSAYFKLLIVAVATGLIIGWVIGELMKAFVDPAHHWAISPTMFAAGIGNYFFWRWVFVRRGLMEPLR